LDCVAGLKCRHGCPNFHKYAYDINKYGCEVNLEMDELEENFAFKPREFYLIILCLFIPDPSEINKCAIRK